MTGAGYRAVDDVVGNILFRSISYEAVVNVSSGQAGQQSIFFQANAAGTTLGFNSQDLTFNNINVDYTPYFDEWVHIGATVSWDGTTRVTNLYINDTLVGTTSTSSSTTSPGIWKSLHGLRFTPVISLSARLMPWQFPTPPPQ